MPVAQVNGVRINYEQMEPPGGRGCDDMVMVHGLATNLAFWFFPYARVLTKRYRVTLFDLRGHGRSQMTASGYTPAALAEDLAGLLDHLGIGRTHVLAHSYGGVVALGLARLNPQRVASLVLADAHLSLARGGCGEGWERREAVQQLVDRYGLGLDTRDPYFGFELLTRAARLLVSEQEVPPGALDLLGPTLGKLGRRTARQWLKLMATTRALEELTEDDGLTLDTLQSFHFPTLALYGDQSLARPTGELLRRGWPQAEFRLLRNAGHFFPATRAGEVLAVCARFWDAYFPCAKDLDHRGYPSAPLAAPLSLPCPQVFETGARGL